MKKTNNLSLFANCVLVNLRFNLMFWQIWDAPQEEAKEEAKSDRAPVTKKAFLKSAKRCDLLCNPALGKRVKEVLVCQKKYFYKSDLLPTDRATNKSPT